MKKMSVFAAIVLLAVVSTASAGTINLFFSTGNTLQDPGLRGLGDQYPVPATGNPNVYVSVNSSLLQAPFAVANAWVYADKQCLGDGVGNEIIASIGVDIGAVLSSGAISAGLSTPLGGYNVFTSPATTGAVAGPWNSPGTNSPTVGAAPALVSNSRAVAVPASTADVLWSGYNPNLAGSGPCAGGLHTVAWPFTPGFNHYRVAQLTVATTDFVGCPDPNNPQPGDPSCMATYNVKLAVGSLKITSVYDPTATVGPTPEAVSFGGSPDPTTNPGNVAGGNAGAVDAVVVVSKIGDVGSFDENFVWNFGRLDGVVGLDDAAFIFNNQAAINAGTVPGDTQPDRTRWGCDVGGFDENFVWLNVTAAGTDAGDKRDNVCDLDDAAYIFNNLQGS